MMAALMAAMRVSWSVDPMAGLSVVCWDVCLVALTAGAKGESKAALLDGKWDRECKPSNKQ